MKKFIVRLMILATLVFVLIPVSSAFAAASFSANGLAYLNTTGQVKNMTTGVIVPQSYIDVTDNSTTTYVSLTSVQEYQITFSNPKIISSLAKNTNAYIRVTFYDSNGTSIISIDFAPGGIGQWSFGSVSNVTKIGIRGLNTSYNPAAVTIYDFDVYGTDTPPLAPINFISSVGTGYVDLYWTANQYASKYKIKKSSTSGGPYTTIVSDITSTSFRDDNIINGRTYYYVVSAVNSGGESGNSSQVTTSLLPEFPIAPTIYSIQGGNTQNVLSWSAVAGATSYNVKRSTTASGPYSSVVSGLTSPTYTNTGLTNGTKYYYVVTSVNSAGESVISNEVNATPLPTTLSAPMGLSKVVGASNIDLSWTASSFATSYKIKRSTTLGGPYTTIVSDNATTSFSDTNILKGVTYYYVVSAVGASSQSGNSSEVNAVIPNDLPTIPTITSITYGDKQNTLSWIPSAFATSYEVKRSLTPFGPYITISSPTTFVDTGLSNGVQYYYVVNGVNPFGSSANSNEVNAIPTGTPTPTPVPTATPSPTTTPTPTIVDNSSPDITYTGTWSTSSPSLLDYNTTISYSNVSTSSALLTFNGTSVNWYGVTRNDHGKADVYIDGVFDQTIDCYSATEVRQTSLYTKSGLTNTTHTIEIVVRNDKNVSSIGNYIEVDKFEIF